MTGRGLKLPSGFENGDGVAGRTATIGVIIAALGAVIVVAVVVRGRSATDGVQSAAGPPPILVPVVAGDRVARLFDARYGLQVEGPAAQGCMVAALDQAPGLVESLGDDPSGSSRFGEVKAIAARCRFQTVEGDALTKKLQEHAGGKLSAGQVSCVRNAVAYYPDDDRRHVIEAGLTDLPAGPLRDRTTELLSVCGIDTSTFARP